MNCPKCQKKLPADYPRVCPSCKMDLTNFYKRKETREQMEAEKVKAARLRRILVICFAVALVCALAVAAERVISHLNDPGPETTEPTEAFSMAAVKAEINSKQVSDFAETEEVTDYVKLTIRDFGEIVVRLRPDIAPISAQNFKDLVARHYYDGLSFHRVMPNFMIQGGRGSEILTPIKGEFSSNGVDNPLLHVRGVLSMARTLDKDSATSQFFLMHADNTTLNGNYAAFGYIVAGLETVDKVCQIPLGTTSSGEQSVPQVDVILESAVFAAPK